MITAVTIGMKSGRTFQCEMEKKNTKKLKDEVVSGKKVGLFNISSLATKQYENTPLWVDLSEVESIMITPISNISVPNKDIISTAGGLIPSA